MERVNVLEQLVDEYFEKYPQANKSTLLVFLNENQYRVSQNYEHECRREDVIYELADSDYNTDIIPTELIEEMTDYYEDQLGDWGSENGWRYILNNVIDYFKEDLKEYKGSDE